MVYAQALVILRGYEKIKWEKPPPWAEPFEYSTSPLPSTKPVFRPKAVRETEPKDPAGAENKTSAWAPINSSGGWL